MLGKQTKWQTFFCMVEPYACECGAWMLKKVFTCHPERSEGSHVFEKAEIVRFAENDSQSKEIYDALH